MPWQNNWVIEEIKRDIKRYRKLNDNNSTTYQNFWGRAKEVITEKFISLQAYLQNKNEPK